MLEIELKQSHISSEKRQTYLSAVPGMDTTPFVTKYLTFSYAWFVSDWNYILLFSQPDSSPNRIMNRSCLMLDRTLSGRAMERLLRVFLLYLSEISPKVRDPNRTLIVSNTSTYLSEISPKMRDPNRTPIIRKASDVPLHHALSQTKFHWKKNNFILLENNTLPHRP